jgi:hypothetical protein
VLASLQERPGGGGTNAQIAYSSTESRIHVLDAGTASGAVIGDYTLSISPITGAPPVGALRFGPRPGQRLDLARARLRLPLRGP